MDTTTVAPCQPKTSFVALFLLTTLKFAFKRDGISNDGEGDIHET
jgi:hypothetical protein